MGYWFTRDERSLATAITDAAAKFSTAIGVPFIGLLLLYFGWRWSFAATGLISLFYFFLFYRIYRNPSEDEKLSQQELQLRLRWRGSTGRSGQSRKRQLRLAICLTAAKSLWPRAGMGRLQLHFLSSADWLPSYLSVSLHVDLFHSDLLHQCALVIRDCYGSPGWRMAGGRSDPARRYDANRVRQSVLVVGHGFRPGDFRRGAGSQPCRALVWISLALGGLAAAAPVAWTVPSLIAPRESVGTLAGAVNLCGQIAAICAPIVTGYIVSASHSFAAAFVTATVILVAGNR